MWLTSLVVSASVCVGQATTQSPHPLHLLVSMTRAPLILLILLYISLLESAYDKSNREYVRFKLVV